VKRRPLKSATTLPHSISMRVLFYTAAALAASMASAIRLESAVECHPCH